MTVTIYSGSKPYVQASVISAQPQHFDDLSTISLRLSQFLRYGPLQTTPAVSPSAGVMGPVAPCPVDLYLARCLSAHLRAEFPDTHCPMIGAS